MELDLLKPKRNNKRSNKDSEKDAVEWIKCQQNPLYFIYNYVHIVETGGSIKFDKEIVHHKMRRTIQSIYNYHNAILMASRQLGKALHINTPIMTASGDYKLMKNIFPGDFVLDGNGKPTRVVAVTDIMHDHKCYKLTFDNHEKIIADENHLWKDYRKNKLFTSDQIYKNEKVLNVQYNDEDINLRKIEKVDSVPVKCIQVENRDGMYLCGRKIIPTHNSTIAGCLIVWASVFYPKNSSIILNMKQNAALNNLRIIRFIIENLPVWMVGNKPLKQKSEIKTYLHLFNDSHIQVFYPSTILISRFIQ